MSAFGAKADMLLKLPLFYLVILLSLFSGRMLALSTARFFFSPTRQHHLQFLERDHFFSYRVGSASRSWSPAWAHQAPSIATPASRSSGRSRPHHAFFTEQFQGNCVGRGCVRAGDRAWRERPNTELKQRNFTRMRVERLVFELRADYENLARAYLRLAEQADRNALLDVTYEPPLPKINDPEIKP